MPCLSGTSALTSIRHLPAQRVTGNPVSPLVTTASTRVVRHDAPNGPGDLTTRPPDGGRSSGTDACALDIFPSRRSALCNEPNG
jgi:hypothetical protein